MHYLLNIKAEPIFPQVQCVTNEDAHKLNFQELPSFKPELVFRLENKAKLTDVLSQASISADGLLLNNKLKKILQDHNLLNHEFFEATVQDLKGNRHNYFWLHLTDEEILNHIDYESSSFFSTEFGFKKNNIKLTSFKDFETQSREIGSMGTIQAEEVKISDSYISEIDLFNVPLLFRHVCISAKLKDKILNENISGIEIEKAPIR